MAVTPSRPSGRRADDVRALRFRFRTLTFSGNYTTGGETLTAASVGLKRILGVIPTNVIVAGPAGVAGTLPRFDVAADGRTVVIRQVEASTDAAGTPYGQEKTNAEAYLANSALDVFIVGE